MPASPPKENEILVVKEKPAMKKSVAKKEAQVVVAIWCVQICDLGCAWILPIPYATISGNAL